MNYSNYRFTLDMQSNVSQVSLPVKLNDTGRSLLIGLTDGGNPYTISKGSLALFCYKTAPNADGVQEAGTFDCIIEDNHMTVHFDLNPKVTSVAGVVDCEIWLYGPNGRQIATPRFILVVDERVMSSDDYPLPEDNLSTLDSIVASEAARVKAEEDRVEAEADREEFCREAVYNMENTCRVAADEAVDAARYAEQTARDCDQAIVSANSAVDRVYERLNELFSKPKLNTEQKLTEAGYYAVIAYFSGCPLFSSVFYYNPSIVDFDVCCGNYILRISPGGSFSLKTFSYTVSNNGQVNKIVSDFTSPHTFSTAKL